MQLIPTETEAMVVVSFSCMNLMHVNIVNYSKYFEAIYGTLCQVVLPTLSFIGLVLSTLVISMSSVFFHHLPIDPLCLGSIYFVSLP